MTDSYYVIFNSTGVDRFAKTPNFQLKSGEYALEVELEVPAECFRKPSIPKTRIVVDPSQLTRELFAETDVIE